MNVRRRICCDASNAFRPAAALNSVFYQQVVRVCDSGVPSKPRHQRQFTSSSPCADVNLERAKRVQFGSSKTQRGYRESHYKVVRLQLDSSTAHDEDIAAALETPTNEQQGNSLEVPRQEVIEEGAVVDRTDVAASTAVSGTARLKATRRAAITESEKSAIIAKKKLKRMDQEVLEYTGKYVFPTAGRTVPKDLPWWTKLHDSDTQYSPEQRLEDEIKDFAKWMRPTEAETAAREAVIEQTMLIVNAATNEKHKIEPFGSSRNGLALSTSDVDLRIFNSENIQQQQGSWMPEKPAAVVPSTSARTKNARTLQYLQSVFESHNDYMLVSFRHARYPLLFMQHKPSGIDVQIVACNDTTDQREWITRQLEKRPGIDDLYAVLRTILDVRGLADVYRGGLGSYAIFVLIVTVLKLGPSQIERSVGKRDWAPNRLSQILHFWGKWNSYKNAAMTDPVKILPKIDLNDELHTKYFIRTSSTDGKTQHKDFERDLAKSAYARSLRMVDYTRPYLLCLVDPSDPTNDLGRKAHGWKHIQATLMALSKRLQRSMTERDDQTTWKGSFLGPAVGAAPKEYGTRRAKAQAFGEKVMKGEFDASSGRTAAKDYGIYMAQERARMQRTRKRPATRSIVLDRKLNDEHSKALGLRDKTRPATLDDAMQQKELQRSDTELSSATAEAAKCVTLPQSTNDPISPEAEGKAVVSA